MKRTLCLIASLFCLAPLRVQSQSAVEFQPGTHIEVQSGADVSADSITVQGTYSGSGTFNGGPLPVEMTAIAAQAGARDVTISWTTATETENYGFEIERRSIGVPGQGREVIAGNDSRFTIYGSPWSKVGFVRGAGTSSSHREYSFSDKNLSPGLYAYRIKQIDQRGSFTYTSALEVEVGLAPKELTLSESYPNPFNPLTTIEFTVPENGKTILRIYNVLGQVIATLFDGEAEAGRIQLVSFDGSNLASGIFYSRLEFGSHVLVRKMLLLK